MSWANPPRTAECLNWEPSDLCLLRGLSLRHFTDSGREPAEAKHRGNLSAGYVRRWVCVVPASPRPSVVGWACDLGVAAPRRCCGILRIRQGICRQPGPAPMAEGTLPQSSPTDHETKQPRPAPMAEGTVPQSSPPTTQPSRLVDRDNLSRPLRDVIVRRDLLEWKPEGRSRRIASGDGAIWKEWRHPELRVAFRQTYTKGAL